MRSSAAVLALAILAASPALSAPIQAFDVEARAIPGAGAQDAANGLGFEAIHQKALRELSDDEILLMTRGLPRGGALLRKHLGGTQGIANGLGLGKSSRELSEEALEFFARELTDEELQLEARGDIPGDLVEGDAKASGKGDLRALALLGGSGLAAAALTNAAINDMFHKGTLSAPTRAREIVDPLDLELTMEDLKQVSRLIPHPNLAAVNAASGASRSAASSGGAGATTGGILGYIIKTVTGWLRKGTPPAQAREVAEALQLLSARADIESRQAGALLAEKAGAAVAEPISAAFKQGALFTVASLAAALAVDGFVHRFTSLPAKRELMEAFTLPVA